VSGNSFMGSTGHCACIARRLAGRKGGARSQPIKTGAWEEDASVFSSASRPESFRERVARATHFPDTRLQGCFCLLVR